MKYLHGGQIGLLSIALALGCSKDVAESPSANRANLPIGAPIAAGLNAADVELANYLSTLHTEAVNDPESGDLRGQLAIAYDINDYPDAARQSYEQARALAPNEFLWPYYLALLLANGGDIELALQRLDQAIEIDSAYVPAWLSRGSYLIDLDREEEALTAFEQAIELGGGPPATVGLARTLLRQQYLDEAVQLLEPLLVEYPHPMVFRLLGRAYRELGRPDDAENALRKGRNVQPISWVDERRFARWEHVRGVAGQLEYGQILLSARRYDDALVVFSSLREHDPNNEILLNNLSAVYTQLGDIDRSIEVLASAIEAHPKSFSSHLNIAIRYQNRGDPDLALDHLRRSIALSPELSAAHEMMGEILMQQGDGVGALVAFKQARSPRAFYYMAMIAGAKADWPLAIRYFENSLQLEPADGRTMLFLGRSLGEADRFAESRAMLAKAEVFGVPSQDVRGARRRLRERESAAPGPQ